MKKIVCYIDMMDRTGAQRVMKNLVTYFDSKGYEVVLINDFDVTDKENSFQIPDTVKRIFLRKKLAGNPIVKNIERVSKLRKYVKSEKPDLVLSFLGRPNIRMLLSTIGLKTKKVVSVRNDPNYEYGKSIISRMLTNILFNLSDGCVFQTKDAQEYFNKKIIKKSTIIFNPVDPIFFQIKRVDNPSNIVTLGRLEKQKNHHLLIKAYANVVKKNNKIDDLYIYGEGELKEELLTLCRKLCVEEKVHFPGNTNNVSEILAGAKMFVLSSDFEGMPNALMEAMAGGVPCISTNCPCGGPKMLITNSDEGILIDCNDMIALTDAIEKIYSDSELQISMSSKTRIRAKCFESTKIFSEWEEYLNSF